VSLRSLDTAALVFARTRGHTATLDRLVAAFSRAGEHAACWLALGALGAAATNDPEHRRSWVRGIRIVAGAYALNYGVKLVVRRSRPELADLAPLAPAVSRLSFPSAHATTSFAAARAYSRVAPSTALYGIAATLAASRPYLGVHYPTDVIAGALLGTAIAGVWPDGGSEAAEACR